MSLNIDIKYFDELGSTNQYAKEEAKKGAAEGTLIIASKQTQGYGRLGRRFYSPNESGIYMSLVLRPDAAIQDSLLITTAAAAATALAIDEICNKVSRIKWVNDIFIDNKKVCGILCEGAVDPGTQKLAYAVLGIGINLYTPSEGFPEEIRDIAGSVFTSPCENTLKNDLIKSITKKFSYYYKELFKKEYYDIYKEKCFIIGRRVTFIKAKKTIHCTVTDIDPDFRLIVRNDKGETLYLDTGEVSIKL